MFRPLTSEEQQLVAQHADLPRKVAVRLRSPYFDLDLLESMGTVGLCLAAQRFKPELGWKFTTYASKIIFWEIKSGIRKLDVIKKTARAKGVTTKLLFNEELLNRRQIHHETEAQVEGTELWALAKRWLPEQEAAAILGYCSGVDMLTLGGRLGVSESRVSQLCKKARARLRARLQIKQPLLEPSMRHR